MSSRSPHTGDSCSHMLAQNLGGSGQVVNSAGFYDDTAIFSQNSAINSGSFNQLEKKVAEMIQGPCLCVNPCITINFDYGSPYTNQLRPDNYTYAVRCRVTDSSCKAALIAKFSLNQYAYRYKKTFSNPYQPNLTLTPVDDYLGGGAILSENTGFNHPKSYRGANGYAILYSGSTYNFNRNQWFLPQQGSFVLRIEYWGSTASPPKINATITTGSGASQKTVIPVMETLSEGGISHVIGWNYVVFPFAGQVGPVSVKITNATIGHFVQINSATLTYPNAPVIY